MRDKGVQKTSKIQNKHDIPNNTVYMYIFFQYLHIRNILHRDIKTQNVFLTGPKKDAKLGDLGIAKLVISNFFNELNKIYFKMSKGMNMFHIILMVLCS